MGVEIEMLIKPYEDYIVDKINEQVLLINFDDPNLLIKLAPIQPDIKRYVD